MPASPAAVQNLYPVILSGGSGTRLWPMSRSAHPKQLLPLLSAESLLQETVMRLDGAPACGAPLIIANEQHRFQIAEQLRQSGVAPLALMLEPVARNTAPAVAAAALWLTSREPDALMLVMPSDHTVKDREAFLAAIAIGRRAAAQGHLVTFGIEATRPETGYGYIRRGAALEISGAYAVEAFVEKPDRARAETYLAAGSYTWNSGIFLFPAALYLAELTRRLPDTVAAVREAVLGAGKDPDFVRLDPASFAAAENMSVDYAVMEHTDKAVVVPVSMGWSDVGAWDALWDIADQRDGEDNVTMGDVLALDCQGSYLRSEEPMIAALGLENMIVIATHDAILVAPRHRAQEIGRIVKTLKEAGRDTLTNAAATR
jgi:mannose-1-phosphate guanylyltransferase/mannose-1-phosphate guanylyltransferase/mannose-6-phosphate isomerase